ncbi:hypothetical protein KR026_008100 [Drosophila bipectinata]|nr:hypothetical protein KR026_008100 [Drosophila bipectinata]
MLHTEALQNNGHPGGIYAPLRQAMSDSESDEEIEIHNASKYSRKLESLHHQPSTNPLQLQAQRSRIPPNSLPLKSPHTRAATTTRIVPRTTANGTFPSRNPQKFQLEGSSYATNMQNTFRSVMLSDNGGVGSELSNFNSEFDSNADNVAILGGSQGLEESKRTPMSPVRRCCFIGSLLLCVFAVVSFVWLVPCGNADGTGACPAVGDRIKTHNWLNNYTRAELKGGVNVVGGLRIWENNLIFMYRGDAFFPEFRPGNERRNGIICLIGSSGAVAWFVEMVDEPVALDCTLIDVDGNGKSDCLVLDEYGELGAINPVSGQWLWWFKERSARKVDAFDFPIILPDLDNDGVLDLLLVTSLSLEQRTKSLAQQKHEPPSQLEARNVLRLLSGRKGSPIGEGFRIHDCQRLINVKLLNNVEGGNVSFSCQKSNGTEQPRSKSLAELFALITNKSIVGQRLLPSSKISQHRNHGQRREVDSQKNIYSLSGRELVVENRGRCPEDCNVTFVLSEVRNGKPSVFRSFSESGMYGMVPAQWHFKNSKNQMSGFVMKFWKWHGLVKPSKPSSSSNNVQKSGSSNHTKNMNAIKDREKLQEKKKQQQQRLKRSNEAEEHRFPPSHQEFDVFGHLVQKRETFAVPSKNQTKSNGISGITGGSYKMQMITETVMLVIFVGADTRIENTSQSNIVQFCRNDRNEVVCQPDLNNQEYSTLIADLDQDGSQELVTYTSTFVHPEEKPLSEWKLLTYVRLLRLQSELPVFYENVMHN